MTTILLRVEEVYKTVLFDPVGAAMETGELLARARDSREPESLVVALRARAWALRQKPDPAMAVRLLNEAVLIAERHALDGRLAEVLMSRSAVLSEMGRLPAAQRDLARAEPLLPTNLQPELKLKRATLLCNLGRVDDAQPLLLAVLSDPASGVDERVKAHNNLAINETHAGRYASARDHIAAALDEAPASGPFMEAIATQTSAWVHVQVGRLAQGLNLFRLAGEMHERAGLPLGEHYTEYADALIDLRLLPEALAAAQQAVAALASTPLMRAEADLRVARLLLLAGRPAEAQDAAATAVAVFRRQGRPGWAARAVSLTHQAQAALGPLTPAQRRGLRTSARKMCEHGLTIESVEAYVVLGRNPGPKQREDLLTARRLSMRGSVLTRLRGRIAAALAAQLNGDEREVLRHCRAGLDDLASHRDALGSMELRALASGHGVELGDLGLRTLIPTGHATRVFTWMERTRAAAVLGSDGLADADEHAVNADLSGSPHAQTPDDEDRIRRTSWLASAPPTPIARLGLRQLRSMLGATVLVEYAVLDDMVHAVVLDSKRSRLVQLGPVKPIVHDGDALLFALRRLAITDASSVSVAAARRSVQALTQRLTARLLAPLAVDADAPLVVVPVGPLQRLPWAPLHAGKVTVAPSASVWARTVGDASAPTSVALVAGPGLPGAVAEIDAISTAYGGATMLLPPESTVASTLAAMHGCDLAHLACHGLIRSDNALFSSLTLSDGPLTMHELSSRIRAPRQVILAACDSAVQTTYAGDEALGFVSALLARGTKGLLASTVLLPDLDTMPLMSSVHVELSRGATMSEALHTARSTLNVDEPGGLVAWCAFQAYGAG